MFEELGGTIREEVVLTLFHAQIEVNEPQQLEPRRRGTATSSTSTRPRPAPTRSLPPAAAAGSVGTAFAPQTGGTATATAVNEHKDVGRNDPCWCGSRQEVQEVPRRLRRPLDAPPLELTSTRDNITACPRPRSRSTSSSRRSEPSSPGFVITFDPDAASRPASPSSSRRWGSRASGTTRTARPPSRPSTPASPSASSATSGCSASTTTPPSCSSSSRTLSADIESQLQPLRRELERLQEDALFNGEYDTRRRRRLDPLGRGRHGRSGLDRDAAAHVPPLGRRSRLPGRARRGEPGRGGRPQVGDGDRQGRERLRALQGRARRPPARAAEPVRQRPPPPHGLRAGRRRTAPAGGEPRSRSTRTTCESTRIALPERAAST